jgi:nitrogen PTS system EIIA component
MADLADLIHPNAIAYRLKATDRTNTLLSLSELAQTVYHSDVSLTLESTLQRERLGGTGVGEGVAIPHARLLGLDKPAALLATLDTPVDFEAPDGRPADIVVLLLSPEDAGADHLKALARISRALRRADIRDSLRSARSSAALHAIMTHGAASQAA